MLILLHRLHVEAAEYQGGEDELGINPDDIRLAEDARIVGFDSGPVVRLTLHDETLYARGTVREIVAMTQGI